MTRDDDVMAVEDDIRSTLDEIRSLCDSIDGLLDSLEDVQQASYVFEVTVLTDGLPVAADDIRNALGSSYLLEGCDFVVATQ